jgi:uncharacterized protein YkwD
MGIAGFFRCVVAVGVSVLVGACSTDLLDVPSLGISQLTGPSASPSSESTPAPAPSAAPLAAPELPPGNHPYRSYARGLVADPKKGAKFRPDLEALLDGMAATYRRNSGLRPVAAAERMKVAARAQALDMALGGYVGHTSRNGYGFMQRFAAFADTKVVGRHSENAAMNWQTNGTIDQARAKTLFQQWVNSSGHRRNLLKPMFGYVATGAVEIGDSLYAVQIFWQKEGAPSDTAGDGAAGDSHG